MAPNFGYKRGLSIVPRSLEETSKLWFYECQKFKSAIGYGPMRVFSKCDSLLLTQSHVCKQRHALKFRGLNIITIFAEDLRPSPCNASKCNPFKSVLLDLVCSCKSSLEYSIQLQIIDDCLQITESQNINFLQ